MSKYENWLLAAKQYNKDQHTRWNRSIRMYKGEITDFRNSKRPEWAHIIEVNFTRQTIDSILPNILFSSPKIMLRPAGEVPPTDQSMQIENAINTVQQQLKMAKEYKKATKDALTLGDGWVKFGIDGQEPYIKRVSPWEVYVDPCCREPDLSDAYYLIHRRIELLEEAKKNPLYNSSARGKLQAVSLLDLLPDHVKQDRKSKDSEYTVTYEIRDRLRQRIVVVDDANNTLRDDPWETTFTAPFPWVHVCFNTITDEFYCMGEPEYLYYLTLEASEKRTQQLNHTRRFNRKYSVGRDVDDNDLRAFKEGEDGAIIKSNSPVVPIVDAPLGGDLINEYQMIANEVQEVTGMRFYSGGSGRTIYSAEDAKNVADAANIRVRERQEVVAECIAVGAGIIYDFMKAQYDWPDDDYNFFTDISTMQRPDDEGRRQQLMQLGQVMAQSPDFNQKAWLADVAKSFHKPAEQYLNMEPPQPPPPDPQVEVLQMKMELEKMKVQAEQQKMQMEVQMKQMELENLQLKINMEKAKSEMRLDVEADKMMMKREKSAMDMGGPK